MVGANKTNGPGSLSVSTILAMTMASLSVLNVGVFLTNSASVPVIIGGDEFGAAGAAVAGVVDCVAVGTAEAFGVIATVGIVSEVGAEEDCPPVGIVGAEMGAIVGDFVVAPGAAAADGVAVMFPAGLSVPETNCTAVGSVVGETKTIGVGA